MPARVVRLSYGALTETVTREVVCEHETHEEAEGPEN